MNLGSGSKLELQLKSRLVSVVTEIMHITEVFRGLHLLLNVVGVEIFILCGVSHVSLLAKRCWRGRVSRRELRKLKMAARETGALKEAKDHQLEKKVEELTWQLQFEKRLRTELAETKAQEIAKLQEALHSMQKQVEEANARVIQEQEAAQKAIEEASPVIKETLVIVQETEKQNAVIDLLKSLKEMSVAVASPKEPESEEKPQKSLNEKQQENQELLIKCISQDLGFSGGKPVAAYVVYKCLLHWRSFEVGRRSDFDCIIETIASSIEVADNNVLAYWLCNTATLLMLLQQTLNASGAASLTPQRPGSSSASLFGRMSQGLQASPQSARLSFPNGCVLGRLDDLRQVEAKYPALAASLFKQQLTGFLEKIYGLIRDNLKKEISPLLGLCIQAPKSLVKGRSQANAAAQQALIAHWQSIVKCLDNYLKMMKANYVSPFLVRKVFTQIFSFINVQLFNSLLLRRECCSFSNGEYVKSGLGELEHWCCYATEEYVGSAWDELKLIRQAVGFLVIHQKPKKTLHEIANELCPVLSIQQLYRISTMYWDDKYGTHSVSSEVISNMSAMMAEDSNNAVSSPFLLDDDSSIPFTVDDIYLKR